MTLYVLVVQSVQQERTKEALMDDAMVTGRMSAEKKAAGNRVLEKEGLNASQAVNLLYDKLAEEQGVGFLEEEKPSQLQWKLAAELVDSLNMDVDERFFEMTRGEIKYARAIARGVI
jgi:antitoxin component of RelBE/YafQ-DinJ toxin-antitoxin module